MAATGKTPILLYGSTTATNQPSAGNLTNSSDGCEIAINVADKNLFFKDSTNTVNTVPIRQSSASSNGWLSSTDWSTFNGKQPAGTYVTSVTGTAPVVSSGGTTPAISMAAATGSVNGYLTSTDWTTFNNKVSSQWTTSGSNIYYNTGSVGIGASSPLAALQVGSGSITPSFSPGITVQHPYFSYVQCSAPSATAITAGYLIGDQLTGYAGGLIYSWSNNKLFIRTDKASSAISFSKSGIDDVVLIDSSNNLNIANGNLVIGTSGKGIDFSATPGTGTSELLADYEEGTWTPTDASGAGLTLTVADANYTKIGRCVYLSARITYPVTVSGLTASIGGLPYTANSSNRTGLSIGYNTLAVNLYPSISVSATSMLLYKLGGTAALNSELSTLVFVFSGYYFV